MSDFAKNVALVVAPIVAQHLSDLAKERRLAAESSRARWVALFEEERKNRVAK